MKATRCAGCDEELRYLVHSVVFDPVFKIAFHVRCRRDAFRKLVPSSATVTGIERDGPL